MDNEQERNEHFKGFARILMQEVDERNRAKAQSTGRYLDEEELHLLIAQRAYDLVYSAIEFMRYSPYIRPMQISSTEVWIHFIPDLTEWPKPQ